ncbi:hypothetical protein Dda_1221 [Drechslerella dactyloides]|uniref:Uncharacterized protein n=1 Tax=Drechslerella dactyloides TaxID=74499 RepID=A0AAD6J8Q0_DREDA|nr:hypothetical protein Dda_1221 [Drechslerella dactyloides]
MVLARQLERRCPRLVDLVSLRASCRNSPRLPSLYRGTTSFHNGSSVHAASIHVSTVSPATNKPNSSGAGSKPRIVFTRPGEHLVLHPKDKDRIQSSLDYYKPKRLRTEKEVFAALRKHGYIPAVDRIDEMLDMNRSPFQTANEFDKITLGLLLKSAKTVDGGIRNPYKIPHLPAGVNPVRTKKGKYPRQLGPTRWFLFPDDTNWENISSYFPLREPPRPWHPTVMMGLKQDYSKEEVARRLEWSKVQNAKKLRNNYHWSPPDPASYPHINSLPPPPPPVIRACNTCHQPRYLMRFWNFYYQRWQHVSSPHRAHDCYGVKTGSAGRLMYAPPRTKIGDVKATKIENKDWIEEETAVKLLFRSGFIPLPTINPELGKIMSQASKCAGDYWSFIAAQDIGRWAVRGGRMNGLVDLTDVRKLDGVEAARKLQHGKFTEKKAAVIQQAQELLESQPIAPKVAAALPQGQLYPFGHPAAEVWLRHERGLHATARMQSISAQRKKKLLKAKIKAKLAEYERVLEEMKMTKAEITLLESGQGEVWINPEFAALEKREQVDFLQQTGEFDPDDPSIRRERPRGPGPFRAYPSIGWLERGNFAAKPAPDLTAEPAELTEPAQYTIWEEGTTHSDNIPGTFKKFENAHELWERQVAMVSTLNEGSFKKLDDTTKYTKRYEALKRRLGEPEDGAFRRGSDWEGRNFPARTQNNAADWSQGLTNDQQEELVSKLKESERWEDTELEELERWEDREEEENEPKEEEENPDKNKITWG